MGEKIPYKARNPGGGRKKLKPEYNAGKNLKEQMDAAVTRYKDGMTLQSIADALSLNPIKVRKLLITAGVYESDVAKMVQRTFIIIKRHGVTRMQFSPPHHPLSCPEPPLPRTYHTKRVYTFQRRHPWKNQRGSRAAAEIPSSKKTAN